MNRYYNTEATSSQNRTVAYEQSPNSFLSEKQEIIAAMGGESTTTTPAVGGGGARSSLPAPANYTSSSGEGTCDLQHKLGVAASTYYPTVRCPAADPLSSFSAGGEEQESDPLPLPLPEYQSPDPEQERSFFEGTAHYAKEYRRWLVTLFLLILALGAVLVASLVVFSPAGEGSPGSSDSTSNQATYEHCNFDRKALSQQCAAANGTFEIPPCALDMYKELSAEFLPIDNDIEEAGYFSCNSSHLGLVALAVAKSNHDEVEDTAAFFALSTLYFALGGVNWRLDRNWLKGSSPCSNFWYGIGCSADGEVISIDLDSNNMEGRIPPELGLLSALQMFNIARNGVKGSLPSEVGLLENLKELDLHSTPVDGPIPLELFKCENLTKLELASTELSGIIATEIGQLQSLEYISLSGNFLTGTLPTELGNLVNLRDLILSHLSGISGTIPSEVWALSNLEEISISAGSLDTAPFPTGLILSGLTKLTVLELSTIDLTGTVPTAIGLLTDLQVLRISYNAITGTIPTQLGLLTQLSEIQIIHEDISGPVPTEIGMLTRMEKISVYSNSLTGTLPSELGHLALVHYINFSRNDLTGEIPTEMCLLSELLSFYHDPCSDSYGGISCIEDACQEEGTPDGGDRRLFAS